VTGDGKKWKGIKWNLVAYPCRAEAKRSRMSLGRYEDFVYGATNINWKKTKERMQAVKNEFDNAEDVHIIVPGQTDLHLSLNRRGGRISYGKRNMPDGEVYYGPIETSTEGHIYFPYRSNRDGHDVEGIRLDFKKGKIVNFSAKKNQKFLESMLDLKGARRIGELGIGCNYGIERYINHLLFDEKIGGTIHLALGESFTSQGLRDGGGKNQSEIHWDLVCDLRKVNGLPGGEIYVDGKLVQKNGKWVF
jgi:aminopeptidase